MGSIALIGAPHLSTTYHDPDLTLWEGVRRSILDYHDRKVKEGESGHIDAVVILGELLPEQIVRTSIGNTGRAKRLANKPPLSAEDAPEAEKVRRSQKRARTQYVKNLLQAGNVDDDITISAAKRGSNLMEPADAQTYARRAIRKLDGVAGTDDATQKIYVMGAADEYSIRERQKTLQNEFWTHSHGKAPSSKKLDEQLEKARDKIDDIVKELTAEQRDELSKYVAGYKRAEEYVAGKLGEDEETHQKNDERNKERFKDNVRGWILVSEGLKKMGLGDEEAQRQLKVGRFFLARERLSEREKEMKRIAERQTKNAASFYQITNQKDASPLEIVLAEFVAEQERIEDLQLALGEGDGWQIFRNRAKFTVDGKTIEAAHGPNTSTYTPSNNSIGRMKGQSRADVFICGESGMTKAETVSLPGQRYQLLVQQAPLVEKERVARFRDENQRLSQEYLVKALEQGTLHPGFSILTISPDGGTVEIDSRRETELQEIVSKKKAKFKPKTLLHWNDQHVSAPVYFSYEKDPLEEVMAREVGALVDAKAKGDPRAFEEAVYRIATGPNASPAENLKRISRTIDALKIKPDLVAFGGDLVNGLHTKNQGSPLNPRTGAALAHQIAYGAKGLTPEEQNFVYKAWVDRINATSVVMDLNEQYNEWTEIEGGRQYLEKLLGRRRNSKLVTVSGQHPTKSAEKRVMDEAMQVRSLMPTKFHKRIAVVGGGMDEGAGIVTLDGGSIYFNHTPTGSGDLSEAIRDADVRGASVYSFADKHRFAFAHDEAVRYMFPGGEGAYPFTDGIGINSAPNGFGVVSYDFKRPGRVQVKAILDAETRKYADPLPLKLEPKAAAQAAVQ